MRYPFFLTFFIVMAFGDCCEADGGKPKDSEPWGNKRVSVFIAPDPVRVGPVEVSVLLQEMASGKSRTDLKTTIYATPVGQVQPKLGGIASTDQLTNKLMVGRVIEIPEEGKWQVSVQIEGPDGLWRKLIPIEVAQPLPAWMNYAGYVAWPGAAVLLFIVHRYFVRRRARLRRELPVKKGK